MTEAKRKRVIYAIFILAVIWGLYNQPWKGRKRSSETQPQTEAVSETQPPTPVPNVAVQTASALPETHWPINPFGPVTQQPLEETETVNEMLFGELVLQGTLTAHGKQVCVINGKVRNVGDDIGAWRVARIANGEVVLIGANNENLTLRSVRTDRERSDESS